MEPTTLTKIAKSRGYRVISDTEDDRILQINHPFDLIQVKICNSGWSGMQKKDVVMYMYVELYLLGEKITQRTLPKHSSRSDNYIFSLDFFTDIREKEFRHTYKSEEKGLEFYKLIDRVRQAIHDNNPDILPSRKEIKDMYEYIRAEKTFDKLARL